MRLNSGRSIDGDGDTKAKTAAGALVDQPQ
jgi:hypothetical protein